MVGKKLNEMILNLVKLELMLSQMRKGQSLAGGRIDERSGIPKDSPFN